MLITGARGFGRQLLEIFVQLEQLDGLAFFDDHYNEDRLFDRFPVYKTEEEVLRFFSESNDIRFALGTGTPETRERFTERFTRLGGQLSSVISPFAHVAKFSVHIGEGSCILTSSIVETGVELGKGCLVNLKASVAHDCTIGDFTVISPGATINGNCRIGHYVHIGSNATILPNITVGNHVVIGAGAVVTEDIPDHVLAVGIPAQIRRQYGSSAH